jgi:membrane-bound lytic murein transglycosylase D
MQGIVEMNGLKNPRALRIGQELMIPRPVGARVADAAESAKEPTVRARTVSTVRRDEPGRTRTTHRVRAGDTLWSISRSFNVDLDDLCRWNGIEDPKRHKLLVGKKLVVYGDRG